MKKYKFLTDVNDDGVVFLKGEILEGTFDKSKDGAYFKKNGINIFIPRMATETFANFEETSNFKQIMIGFAFAIIIYTIYKKTK